MCPATLPRSADTFERHARHVDPTFVRLLGVLGYGRVFTRAEDVWLWDAEGRRYLDLVAGYGTMNLGHNHPALLAEISEFLRSAPPNVCHVGVTPWAGALAERLGRLAGAPLQIAVLTSSGAEAVEAGLKLARLATGRAEIVFAAGAFHGLTAGTLSVMGDTRLRRRLEPLLPGCHEVPFGDLPALERALSRRRAAAFVVEPVQCEGGIVLPPPGYLAAARELCERTGALLVLDEVQTGLGRTGRTFAFQDEGVVPDVLVLAKALGGGLVACGAALTSAEVFERASGDLGGHGLLASTFGGNALSCVAALATLDVLEAEGLAGRAAARGARLVAALRARLAGHPLVRDVRGRGLLVGVELGPTDTGLLNRAAPWLVSGAARNVLGHVVALRLLERGFVAQPTGHAWNVLRIEPPLTICDADVDSAAIAVAEVLADYPGLVPLLREVVARLARQGRAGWNPGGA